MHARSRAPAWSAWLACRKTGARFVTTWHGVYKENAPGKRRYNAVMARGERIIAISQFVAAKLKARHHVDPARLRVIPRGVDTAIFDPAAVSGDRMARLANQWRLPDGASTIMLPARLTRWKGQSVMLEAMARLERQDVCLVLVGAEQGRARYRRELLARAEALGIVRTPGAPGRPLRRHASRLDAGRHRGQSVRRARTVRPHRDRGAGHGPPRGGQRRRRHGGDGGPRRDRLARAPRRPRCALAATLDVILRLDPAERAAFGARARASVCIHYTTAAMQQATLEVYRELLA